MNINGKCSLVIRGNSINQEAIEQTLGLKATRFNKKGFVASKVIGVNPFDVWCYEVEIYENESIENAILGMLNKTEVASEHFKDILANHEVYLKCYISSKYAQIQFDLSASTLRKMSESLLRIHFSILSWGEVEE